jgi:hypothetical protein
MMIWKYTIVLATSLFVASCQSKDSTSKSSLSLTVSESNFITGNWTYRSLLNNPIDTVQFNDLEFATAIMQLKRLPNDSISGKLDMGPSGILTIQGFLHYCPDGTGQFELRGTGIPATRTQGWIYDYKGFIVAKWKGGINQKDVLVGTLMRAANHGNSKAGLVASFYMVRRE